MLLPFPYVNLTYTSSVVFLVCPSLSRFSYVVFKNYILIAPSVVSCASIIVFLLFNFLPFLLLLLLLTLPCFHVFFVLLCFLYILHFFIFSFSSLLSYTNLRCFLLFILLFLIMLFLLLSGLLSLSAIPCLSSLCYVCSFLSLSRFPYFSFDRPFLCLLCFCCIVFASLVITYSSLLHLPRFLFLVMCFFFLVLLLLILVSSYDCRLVIPRRSFASGVVLFCFFLIPVVTTSSFSPICLTLLFVSSHVIPSRHSFVLFTSHLLPCLLLLVLYFYLFCSRVVCLLTFASTCAPFLFLSPFLFPAFRLKLLIMFLPFVICLFFTFSPLLFPPFSLLSIFCLASFSPLFHLICLPISSSASSFLTYILCRFTLLSLSLSSLYSGCNLLCVPFSFLLSASVLLLFLRSLASFPCSTFFLSCFSSPLFTVFFFLSCFFCCFLIFAPFSYLLL